MLWRALILSLRSAAALTCVLTSALLSVASALPEPQEDDVAHRFVVPAGADMGFDYVAEHPPIDEDDDRPPSAVITTTLACDLSDDVSSEVQTFEQALPAIGGVNDEVLFTDEAFSYEHVLDMQCLPDGCNVGARFRVRREPDATGDVVCELSAQILIDRIDRDATVTFGLFDLDGNAVEPNAGVLEDGE